MIRVCNFPDNGLGINLRLTALVSKLATFPQPLLKSVLLHPDVVVQPACSTLFSAICEYLECHEPDAKLLRPEAKLRGVTTEFDTK